MKRPLLDQFDREILAKYNGKWGFQMPNYATSIIIRYNILKIQAEVIKIQAEVIRRLRIKRDCRVVK